MKTKDACLLLAKVKLRMLEIVLVARISFIAIEIGDIRIWKILDFYPLPFDFFQIQLHSKCYRPPGVGVCPVC